MRRTLLALGGVAFLATACGSSVRASSPTTAPAPASSVASSTATPPASPPPATTAVPATTVPDTSLVPTTITAAYVNAVLVQLNHIYGDAVRSSVTGDKLTAQAIDYIGAMYNKPLGKEEQSVFAETLAGSLKNIRPVPGDPLTSVDKLVYTSSSCIYARVRTNLDPIVIRPVKPAADEFMGLEQRPRGAASGINRTPWIVFFDIVNNTATNVPNQCPAR